MWKITCIIVPILLFLTFCLIFYITNKVSENKKIMPNLIIIGTVVIAIAALITIGLSFLLSEKNYVLMISSPIWGISSGYLGGLINYKYKYKKIYRHTGL